MRAGQDRDEGQGDVNPVLLELDKKLSDQNVRVNKLQLKGQQLANQLQLNFSEIEKQRANIRDSLRSRYYNDTTVVTNGRVAIGSSRTFGDEPNRVSIYFAMVEQAEMKNKQSRIRAMYGSYKNLIKTYLIEARELDRLEILKDMAVKGMDIKPSQLNRPTAASSTGYRTFDEDEDDNESEKKGGVSRKSGNRSIGIEAVTGPPRTGDLVAAKSKIIFVLKDRGTADRLMRSPTSFSVRTLEQMANEGRAAKLSPTSQAVLQFEDEESSLVRIKITGQDDPANGFIGWVSPNLLTKIKSTE